MSMSARLAGSPRAALAAPIACGCCLAAGAVYVAAIDPSDGGTFIPCPFRTITGLWCPGCGLTRAVHHLLRGHVVTAMHFNLFVIPIVLAIAASWLSWLTASAGLRPTWSPRLSSRASTALIGVAVAFAVIRNLPGVPGLRG